ncbi:MAG: restriction endonuclease [Caldilineales bacterium]|nr:restriction endonuclease [Caldilineales bacterium]
MTTYLDAALHILRQAGQPLHYAAIAEQALAQQVISPQGLTPEATMGSRLYTDTKQEGSLFVRMGQGRFGLAQWQPKGIDAQVADINAATRRRLKERVLAMPPERFEVLVRELLIRMGFDETSVSVTPYSGDGGIDVAGVYRAAGLTEMSAAVQVKRWKNNVGAPVVTQLRGSLQVHQQGIIITTSDFSKSARAEAAAANKTRIGLINGEELIDLLIKHQVGVVKRPLEIMALDDEYWGELAGPTPAAAAAAPAAASRTEEGDKPAAFTLLGRRYVATTWRQVLVGACQALAQHHGDAFAAAAFTVRGRTRQYIAADPAGMITPATIPGTALWVEANQSRKSVLQVIARLLQALGHGPEAFAVVLG